MGTERLRRVGAVLQELFRSQLSRTGNGSADPDRDKAREIRLALERLGPFYVKLGQLLSTRPDIVSQTVVEELEKLHDQVTPLSFATFEPVLREELGPEWKEQFRDFDILEPLGAASLAQVYRVTLPDGRPGVVKIQRPGVRETVVEDMALMRKAARMVGRCAPRFSAVVDVDAMLGVLFDAMRPELDFSLEAANMAQARTFVEGFRTLSVPEPVLSTRRVLVQGLAGGSSVREFDSASLPEDKRKAIGTDLLALQYRGFFVDRMFHADPHPGNVFVDSDGTAHLIDWGMVGRIDRRTSLMIMLVLLNLAQNDGNGLAKAWIELGHATAWADVPAFTADMAALTPKIATASLAELNFGVTLSTVLMQSTKRGIKTNPMISVLGKSFANVEGSVRLLAPELSITEVFRAQLAQIVLQLIGESASVGNAARAVTEMLLGANSAGEQLRGMARDLADREFTFQVDHEQRGGPDRSRDLRNALMGFGAATLWSARRNRR